MSCLRDVQMIWQRIKSQCPDHLEPQKEELYTDCMQAITEHARGPYPSLERLQQWHEQGSTAGSIREVQAAERA